MALLQDMDGAVTNHAAAPGTNKTPLDRVPFHSPLPLPPPPHGQPAFHPPVPPRCASAPFCLSAASQAPDGRSNSTNFASQNLGHRRGRSPNLTGCRAAHMAGKPHRAGGSKLTAAPRSRGGSQHKGLDHLQVSRAFVHHFSFDVGVVHEAHIHCAPFRSLGMGVADVGMGLQDEGIR